jgi:hypothetical protein
MQIRFSEVVKVYFLPIKRAKNYLKQNKETLNATCFLVLTETHICVSNAIHVLGFELRLLATK